MKNSVRIVEYGYTIVDFDDLDETFDNSDGRSVSRKEPYGRNNPRPAISRHTTTEAIKLKRL